MSTHRPASLVALALACAAVLASLSLVACGPAVPPVPEDAIQPEFEPAGLAERMMPFDQRKAEMPDGLPIEIPVIDGSVMSTSVDVGEKTWYYTIDTTGPVILVSDWYTRAYQNAQWSRDDATETAKLAVVDFKKHGARTKLRVKALKGERVRVEAAIGLSQIPGIIY